MADFEALIAELRENPGAALSYNLDAEQLLALQKKIDPYARVAGPERDAARLRVAMASFTNLRESYMRKFTMTGAVGFLFRMLEEWEVPVESRRWTPKRPKAETKPFTVEELATQAQAFSELTAQLKEAEALAQSAKGAAEKFNAEQLTFGEEEMKEVAAVSERLSGLKAGEDTEEAQRERKELNENPIYQKMMEMNELMRKADEAQGKLLGLRYAVTLHMRNMGLEADYRLPATESMACKHPLARGPIQETPNRHRGILPQGQLEIPPSVGLKIIREFLENYFEYNPDAHVKGAYDEVHVNVERRDVKGLPGKSLVDVSDPGRLPLSVLLAKRPLKTSVPEDQPHIEALTGDKDELHRQHVYNTLCRLLSDEGCAGIARYLLTGHEEDPDRCLRWRTMLMPKLLEKSEADASVGVPAKEPPQDTFHRWSYYMEVNMEALREVTNSLYHEKPDFDFAIQLMDYHEGSPEEVDRWGQEFRDKNQDRVIGDIKVLEFGGWTILGDFAVNRKAINFFNKRTEVIERIFQRYDDDKNLGELLMRQRVRQKKAENIKEAGPDAPGLAQYKETRSGGLPGAVEVLTPEEKLRLERAKGDLKAARELEVLEQCEEKVRRLEAEAKLRELTKEEEGEMEKLLRNIEKAKEMLRVPDDAIQVDVWNMSHADGGSAKKTSFYSAAAASGSKEDEGRAAANLAIARRAKKVEAPPPKERPHAPFSQNFLEQERAARGSKESSDAAPGQTPVTLEEIDAAIGSV